MSLDWQERKTPREWSAQAGDLVLCVYPMRDCPLALSLDVKWQVYRRAADGAELVRQGYGRSVVAAQALAAGAAAELLGLPPERVA